MPSEERQILREHFIEAFVRELIINSYDPSKDLELQKELEKKQLSQVREQLDNSNGMPMLEIQNPNQENPPIPIPNQPQNIKPFQPIISRGAIVSQDYQPIPQINVIPLPQEQYHPQLKPGQKPDTVNLGKLASMLIDPSVVSVECPGPYKNVLVNRSGSMQTSAVTLTPEEIEAIMQNVSEKTRIPLTSGVFKAAVQDLLVTAVISDFVGTRFLIQKRSPFQRY